MPSTLTNLVQSIHLSHPPKGIPSRFILSTFSSTPSETQFILYGSDPDTNAGSVQAWESDNDLSTSRENEEAAAEAIKQGYIHLEFDLHSKDHSEVEVQLLCPGIDAIKINLTRTVKKEAWSSLFEATMDLVGRSQGGTTGTDNRTEIRALQLELSQKESEIRNLNTKLQSVRAAAVRSNSQDTKKKVPISPQKKPPANASALQPNQKRRKAVEDEFAGSSDEEDDD